MSKTVEVLDYQASGVTPSTLDKNVKDLNHQFQTPQLVAIQNFLNSDRTIESIGAEDQSLLTNLLKMLPKQAFGGPLKPETLTENGLNPTYYSASPKGQNKHTTVTRRLGETFQPPDKIEMETEYRGRLFHAMGGNHSKYPSTKQDKEREAQLEKDMIALMKEDFKKRTEFYEANKGKYLTDKEREYLEKIAATSKGIDAVASKMLLAVSEDNVTKEIIQTKLTEALESYKTQSIAQTTKDLPRNSILVKSPNGEVNPLSIEGIDLLEISGAQKDFIKTAWQQGTFGGRLDRKCFSCGHSHEFRSSVCWHEE